MSDVGTSMAEQSTAWVITDRDSLMERWRRRTRGVPRLAMRLPAEGKIVGDFMARALAEMSEHLFPVMRALAPERSEVLDRLVLMAVEEKEAFAVMHRFEDGSTRVVISDGQVGLLGLLAALTAVWHEDMGGRGWRQAFRTAKVLAHLPEEERLVPTLAAALRWNLIHRRVWGNSAILALEPATEVSTSLHEILAQLAWMFVIAHECAHAILGHTSADIGSWDAEHAADNLALRVVQGFLRSRDEGIPEMLHALAAARLAFLGADLIERTLFARPPVQHPPAAKRWRQLIADVGAGDASTKAVTLTAGLDYAAQRACDLRIPLPNEWWSTAYADPRAHLDVHDPDYYQSVPFFDRLSFSDGDLPARLLKGLPAEEGRQLLAAAFATRDDSLAAGLRMLGIDEEFCRLAEDRSAALSVYSLCDLITHSPVGSAIADDTGRLLSALSTSALMAGCERGIYTAPQTAS